MAKRGGARKNAGRKPGSIKPKLADHFTQKQIDTLVKKAYDLANGGNEVMLRFILEQIHGKAIQPTDMNIVGDLNISFDAVFNES